MKNILEEVKNFIIDYELATNSHDFEKLRPLISENAIYWFSNGTYVGIKEIESAITKVFNEIKDEVYTIKDLNLISIETNSVTCIYKFHWKGFINNEFIEGNGRGTNVIVKINDKWKMIHEHLSSI